MNRDLLLLMVFSLGLLACGGGGGGGGGGGPAYLDIDLATLRAELYADLADGTLDDMVVIDTAHQVWFDEGAIPGAISIPLATLQADGLAALVYPDLPFFPANLVGTQIPADKRLVFYLGGSG